MEYCITCGMPMTEADHHGKHDLGCKTCVYCTNADGSVKSCEEIFEGGVNFFMQNSGSDRALAEKLVRKNMLRLPYWKCLAGEIASDEEFEEAMKGL